MEKFYIFFIILMGKLDLLKQESIQEFQKKKQKQNQHSKHLPDIKTRTYNELGSNKTTQNRNGGTTPNTTS